MNVSSAPDVPAVDLEAFAADVAAIAAKACGLETARDETVAAVQGLICRYAPLLLCDERPSYIVEALHPTWPAAEALDFGRYYLAEDGAGSCFTFDAATKIFAEAALVAEYVADRAAGRVPSENALRAFLESAKMTIERVAFEDERGALRSTQDRGIA